MYYSGVVVVDYFKLLMRCPFISNEPSNDCWLVFRLSFSTMSIHLGIIRQLQIFERDKGLKNVRLVVVVGQKSIQYYSISILQMCKRLLTLTLHENFSVATTTRQSVQFSSTFELETFFEHYTILELILCAVFLMELRMYHRFLWVHFRKVGKWPDHNSMAV